MDHWSELIEKIKLAGLYPLVHQTPEAAMEAMSECITGEETNENYDPLLYAHWALVNNAMTIGGMSVLMGDRCPICYCKHVIIEHMKTCTEPGCGAESNMKDLDFWVDHAVDGQIEVARSKGLIPPIQ